MEWEISTTGMGLPSQYRPVLTTEKKMASAQRATPESMRTGQVRAATKVRARGC
jgi:hypothetical protein